MNTNRPSDANPPNVIQFFGFESDDRAVTLFGREAPPTMPQHVSRSFKQCERVLSSRMNKKKHQQAISADSTKSYPSVRFRVR